jgi:hypothetical protein
VITIVCRVVPDSYTGTGSSYSAETEVSGKRYSATSRHGAPNRLARELVEAGVPDDAVTVRYAGLAGCGSYRSLHAMAELTYSEGNSPLSRARYVKFERRAMVGEAGAGEETADVLPEGSERNASGASPELSVTVICGGCGGAFPPKRSDAKFCSGRCRVAAHRREREVAVERMQL